jgi:dTDP-4-dehydrorhamnose reductase
MTIYIFGSNGMLGNYIHSYLKIQKKNCVCFTRGDLDVSSVTYEKLESLFSAYKMKEYDVIINCIGIIPQSKNINDTSSRNYFLINSLFPNMLSTFAYTRNLKFIHITTDCVFSGSKGNYTELDDHDETNNYGVSKSLGELGYKSTIIRTSIIGEELKNKYSLLEWVKKHTNTSLSGYTNHYWNGVTCLQLSKIINKMIDENIWWFGVRHIYSPTSVTKYELVTMINDTYNLNNRVDILETETTVNKTLNSIYDVNRRFNIPELKIQIEELKSFSL